MGLPKRSSDYRLAPGEPTNPLDRAVWALQHRIPDLEAENERLREALEPFVAAYEAASLMYCPSFQGPLDLALFDHARGVLRG